MSAENSKPVTAVEMQMARDILSRFERSGQVSEAAGSMHDGSKRLRDTEEWDAISYDESASEFMFRLGDSGKVGNQDPVVSQDVSDKPVDLPPGVQSLKDWGTTLCKLPQVSHLNASYEELTKMPDRKSYLRWISTHGINRGGRFEDFAKYLKATQKESFDAESCFPGTTERRERKKEN